MQDSYDEFKTIMEENFGGHPVEIRYGESMSKMLPAVRIFAYRDYPRDGWQTCVTYGLSLANHKEWTDAKPELTLCVNSNDPRWIGVTGFIADVSRGKMPCSDGQVLTFNYPLSEETQMQGLLVGGSAQFSINPIPLPDRKVLIRNLYPIYMGESDLIEDKGWKIFVERIGEDGLRDIRRPDLSVGAESTIEKEMKKKRAGERSRIEDV